jgi:hypothetical protein
LRLVAFDYRWWVLLHIMGVFGFLIAHGVSISVALKLRKERDRARITELLQFSGGSVLWMYVSLGLLLVGGIAAGLQNHYFSFWWIWISLGLLVAAVAEMAAVGAPYYRKVKEAVLLRASGVPRKSDEELDALLGSSLPMMNAIFGFVVLVVILWLMIWKPLWMV